MKRAGPAIVIIFALLALACGFGTSTGALYLTQPSSTSTATIHFVVNKGDSAAAVAGNLQKAGLIRNAQLFRLWARYRHEDSGIEPGIYTLKTSMTMDQILVLLQQGKPDERLAGVPDGLRVTQYAAYLAKDLPNFNSDRFLAMVKSGVEPNGTKLWDKYWYVQQPKSGSGVVYALEGYLYPDSYFFQLDADETAVVERMLDQLGELLCPGPAGNPAQYIHDKDQCQAHGATIGDGNINIFLSMETSYFTKDPVQALHDTLNVAGLTIREIANLDDAIGVASTYHNRLLFFHGVSTDTVGYMGSDPSAQYARDTDSPPQDGHWWKDLGDKGQNVDPKSPYNTESGNHPGLPPSAIANAPWKVIVAAASPKVLKDWPYFYFVSDKCGKIVYGKDYNDFQQNVVPKMNTGNC